MMTIDGIRSTGPIIAPSLVIQNPYIVDALVQEAAGIAARKLKQQHAISYKQKTGTAIVADTEDVHIVYAASAGSSQIIAVEVMCAVPPTGDHAFTVDVQVAKQGESFTSVLTGTISVTASAAALQVFSGTLIGSPALEAGDVIRVFIAVSGSTSSQGQGLVVTVTTNEDPS